MFAVRGSEKCAWLLNDFQRIVLIGAVVPKCPTVCGPGASDSPRSFLIIQITRLHLQGVSDSVGQR